MSYNAKEYEGGGEKIKNTGMQEKKGGRGEGLSQSEREMIKS